MNNLDAVWASLSSADRIVLLGHDRDLLTAAEKVQLASLAAAKADRRAQVRPTRRKGDGERTARNAGRGPRGSRVGTRGRRAA